MFKDRNQLLKEIEKLKEERHHLRATESLIYTILAIFASIITGALIIYTFSDNLSKNAIYVSIFLNIVSCFYIIRELKKKYVKVHFNDDSPLNIFEKGERLYTLSEQRLNELLSECLKKENYETASKVRDELKKFKK